MTELRRMARPVGSRHDPVRERGIAVYTRARPESVYIAHPRSELQIEVFDPSPRKARQIALSGRVKPVG